LAAERFFADQRYHDGLAPTCLDCHNGVPTTRELRRRRLVERYRYLEPVLGVEAFNVFVSGLLENRVSGGEPLPPPGVGRALGVIDNGGPPSLLHVHSVTGRSARER
jgi:hypothetical protein